MVSPSPSIGNSCLLCPASIHKGSGKKFNKQFVLINDLFDQLCLNLSLCVTPLALALTLHANRTQVSFKLMTTLVGHHQRYLVTSKLQCQRFIVVLNRSKTSNPTGAQIRETSINHTLASLYSPRLCAQTLPTAWGQSMKLILLGTFPMYLPQKSCIRLRNKVADYAALANTPPPHPVMHFTTRWPPSNQQHYYSQICNISQPCVILIDVYTHRPAENVLFSVMQYIMTLAEVDSLATFREHFN